MAYNNILYENKDGIAVITLNRPEKMNALNKALLEELQDVLIKIKDDESIDVIIITGAGDKAFASGADISEFKDLSVLNGENFAKRGQEVFNLIEDSGKPVIGAVNGFALGGGCELALACHIRIASSKAHFGQPEVNLGIIPGYGGTQRLSRLINPSRALEYILTGEMIDAEEAYRMGLVNKVYTPNEFMNKTFEMAKKIKSKGQLAVRMALKAVKASENSGLTEGLAYEASLFGICCGTADFKEGTKAFLDKRKPTFSKK